MKLIVQGHGEVTLTQGDFVAAGGEGQIYGKGSTAYKIYHNPGKMIPVGKIAELAVLTHPDISRPDRVLLDPKSHQPVGYTTRFIRDAMPLCQILTRAFREREGLDHPKMLALVQNLQEIVRHVHKAGLLIVDLNEMNFLVDRLMSKIYAIDVDSYQTPHYPATALMPSVRDWRTALGDFTEGSDWFSFACVAYQMFTGIHPYKGKHPTLHGFEARMQAGVSVFDPSVSVPKVVYPMDVIPPAYRAWFKAVLQDGKREAPPTSLTAVTVAAVLSRHITSGDNLDIVELLRFTHDVLGFVDYGGATVVWTSEGVYVDSRRVSDPIPNTKAVGFSPKMNRAVVASVNDGMLGLFDTSTRTKIPVALRADEVMSYGGRIYVRSRDRILEIVLTDAGQSVVASTRLAADVLEHATRLYDGVALQNLLGSPFVSVFPRSGATYQSRMPELAGYKIVDARYDRRVLMVLGAKGGQYDRLSFRFSEDHSAYQALAPALDVTPAGLNFIVLDSGVCVHLTEDERLEVSALGSSKVKEVKSAVLGNDMRLVHSGGRVAFIRGDRVFRMTMR